MPEICFTANLKRHVKCPTQIVPGRTVSDALRAYFDDHPQVRGYVLSESGLLRRHMAVFVDGVRITDDRALSDPVEDGAVITVMQALSGG